MDFKLKGNAFVGEGELEKAVEAYSQGISFVEEGSSSVTEQDRGQLHILLSNRAQCQLDLGEVDCAMQDIELSIEVKSDFPKAYVRRAAIMIQLFKYQEAREDLAKAESLDSSPQFKEILKESRSILSGRKWVPNVYLRAHQERRSRQSCLYVLKDLVSDEEGYFDHALTTKNFSSEVVSRGAVVQEKYVNFFRAKAEAAYRSGKPIAVRCVRHCILECTEKSIKDSVGGDELFTKAVDRQLKMEYGPWFLQEEEVPTELKKFLASLEEDTTFGGGNRESQSSSVASRNPLLNHITQANDNTTKTEALVAKILAGEFNEHLSTAARYKPADEDRALDIWSPVHEATRCWQVEILEALLKMGANSNIRDTDGETPLFIAASNGATELVELLCKNGADVKVKADDGWSCVMQASRRGYVETVEALCQHNSPVTGPGDMFGRQALDLVRFQMAPNGPTFTSEDDPTGSKHKTNLKKIERILLAAKKRGL